VEKGVISDIKAFMTSGMEVVQELRTHGFDEGDGDESYQETT